MRFAIFFQLLLISLTLNANTLVRIAAAADIQPALTEIEQEFKQQNPAANIAITYGASGILTSQLRQGAPFQLFLSANEEYPKILIQEGLTRSDGSNYANGRIAFITHEDITADTAINALKEWNAIKRPSDRLAIANPLHAPNGIAAMSWIKHWQIDESLAGNLVFGENASQSVQFVLSGAARSGIVAWPLISKREKLPGNYWLISEDEHDPSPRNMVLMHQASEMAIAFYDFMLSDIAKEILIDHGFGVP